jgi:hypothetical protein
MAQRAPRQRECNYDSASMAARTLAEAKKRHRVAGNAANTFTVIGLLASGRNPQAPCPHSGQPGSVQRVHECAHEIRE